jgi:phage terminase large subunit-like protein
MNIVETMSDPKLFGNQFAGESWTAWLALLAGFYGLPMTTEQQAIFQSLTGRSDTPETAHDELWLVIGRRGGKSFIAALLAVFEAVFNNHKDKLAAGEVATIAVIASDRKQARTVLRYIKGLLQNPLLEPLVLKESPESIELTNRCSIEIMTASHRASRGYTLACVIADEIAFWLSEGANPDADIIRAIRPSLATLNGKLIALSSPYARYAHRSSQIRSGCAPSGRS